MGRVRKGYRGLQESGKDGPADVPPTHTAFLRVPREEDPLCAQQVVPAPPPSARWSWRPRPTQARVPPRGRHPRNAESRPRIHFPHFISVQLLESPEAGTAPPAHAQSVRRGPCQAGRWAPRRGGRGRRLAGPLR